MNVVLSGALRWSSRLSIGPLPVAPYCAAKPRKASMARRPFLISLSFRSLVFSGDSLRVWESQHVMQCVQARIMRHANGMQAACPAPCLCWHQLLWLCLRRVMQRTCTCPWGRMGRRGSRCRCP
jgi:hypothetical protein